MVLCCVVYGIVCCVVYGIVWSSVWYCVWCCIVSCMVFSYMVLCSAVVTCSVVHGCVELCSTVRKKSGSLIVIHTHILLLFTLELHNNLPLK